MASAFTSDDQLLTYNAFIHVTKTNELISRFYIAVNRCLRPFNDAIVTFISYVKKKH